MTSTQNVFRRKALEEALFRPAKVFSPPRDHQGRALRIPEFFGKNTFDLPQMKERLPEAIYLKIVDSLKLGKPLDADIAASVASAVLKWATEKGATHFCHWFQPQTGSTAEKHDAFLSLDAQGRPKEEFTQAQLIQSEPDASSFPSGGMRNTFEARGYTAWDPSSPMFITESGGVKTLCIPSVFLSYHGDALDEKTPLLKSLQVLSDKAKALLELMGDLSVHRVVTTLGIEQEYFLMDRAFYAQRPDLIMCNRTLIGGQPPKGQQLEDHYFGSIPERVQAFMADLEYELLKLSVPLKTRHNEVAPCQFETAPIFEEADLAIDHNQLVMETLKKIAQRHDFKALLHEKPFAGLNGSGKHCNWSLSVCSDDPELDGLNLLNPGKLPSQNLRFLIFLAAVLKGVHQHGGLLRAGIATSGNDHRLGANEAPPAILSVFLGDLLSKVLDEIETTHELGKDVPSRIIKLAIHKLPQITQDATDRNRTSPFAFTGNKFEFRAVGASVSPSFPVALVNTAVAGAISELTESLRQKLAQKTPLDLAIFQVVREVVRETKAIRFEGNNYSSEWATEAEKRGLPHLRKTPEALAQLLEPSSKHLLTSLGVFSEAELISRFHVRIERYLKDLQIELDTLKQLVDTAVLPACFDDLESRACGMNQMKLAGFNQVPQETSLKLMTEWVLELQEKRTALSEFEKRVVALSKEEAKAALFASEGVALFDKIRSLCDRLEGRVDDRLWPLPKYREMLFLS
ncbi:MAG: glutamine synthetase III [Bdellovibrionia bacterium]